MNKTWEKSFDKLKDFISRPPIQLAPKPEKVFVVHTDASDECKREVLLLECEGLLHPVGYASRMLENSEKN